MHCYTTYNNLCIKWNSMEHNLYIMQDSICYYKEPIFSGNQKYNEIIKIDQYRQLKKIKIIVMCINRS